MTRAIVTGGAGDLGSSVVRELLQRGYQTRVMSRSARRSTSPAEAEWAQADLATGAGLADALAGADIVVHTATDPPHSGRVDGAGTQRLLAAAHSVGVRHITYISIVGIDRMPIGVYAYYRQKLAAEKLVTESGIPWSILRATQFHSFIDRLLRGLTLVPLITLLPGDLLAQPVDSSEVAHLLADVVDAGPSGRLPDFGGPDVLSAGAMVRPWLAARGMQRLSIPLHVPGKAAQGFRLGQNTCPDAPRRGAITWAEWLRRTYPASSLRALRHTNVQHIEQ